MIDLNEEKLDKADNFLTKIKTLLKKHWGIILILVLLYGVYRFFSLVGEEMDSDKSTPTEDVTNYDDLSWEYDVSINGDTTWYYNGEIVED